jgi:hypothetical protein
MSINFINKKIAILASTILILALLTFSLMNNSWFMYDGYKETSVHIQSNQDLAEQVEAIYSKVLEVYNLEQDFFTQIERGENISDENLKQYNTIVSNIVGIVKSIDHYQNREIDQFAVQYDSFFGGFEELFLYRMSVWNSKDMNNLKKLDNYIFGLSENYSDIKLSNIQLKPKSTSKITESQWEINSDKIPALLFAKSNHDNSILKSPISYKSYLKSRYQDVTTPVYIFTKVNSQENFLIPEGEWEFYVQYHDSYPSISWLSYFPSERETFVVTSQIDLSHRSVEDNTGSMAPHILKYSSDVLDSEDYKNKYYEVNSD